MSHDGSRARSHLEDLVVISGLSGAGKSSAMNVFEDAGYFCVDNLPAEMIRSLAELFRHPGSKVERAAVVCDSRGGEYLSALAGRDRRPGRDRRAVPRRLPRGGRADADRPLQGDAPPPPARAAGQRRRRHPLPRWRCSRRSRSARTICIDTSGLSAAALRRKVADELLEPTHTGKLAVTFTSLRAQARPAARRRPRVRRALPAQPALRARPAAADRLRRADRRLRRRATAASRSSTTGSCRCWSTCCRSTSPRARRT